MEESEPWGCVGVDGYALGENQVGEVYICLSHELTTFLQL